MEKQTSHYYGKNGNILQENNYIFEIGSITKTFTASLLAKAIIDGKIEHKHRWNWNGMDSGQT